MTKRVTMGWHPESAKGVILKFMLQEPDMWVSKHDLALDLPHDTGVLETALRELRLAGALEWRNDPKDSRPRGRPLRQYRIAPDQAELIQQRLEVKSWKSSSATAPGA